MNDDFTLRSCGREPPANVASCDVPERVRAPQPPCLNEAYRRYAPYVAAIGARILGGGDQVDDLVQDVFVEATRSISGLSSPEAIKGWLARIAVRTAVRRLRRVRMQRAVHLPLDEALEHVTLASSEATPEQGAMIARVSRALEQLDEHERAAWVTRYVQEETLEQAAELCACSLSTYQRRLRRASARLDKRLLALSPPPANQTQSQQSAQEPARRPQNFGLGMGPAALSWSQKSQSADESPLPTAALALSARC